MEVGGCDCFAGNSGGGGLYQLAGVPGEVHCAESFVVVEYCTSHNKLVSITFG